MKKIFLILLFLLSLPIIVLQNQAQEVKEKPTSPEKVKLPSPRGPSKYILLKGSVRSESVKDLEKFFQQEMLPIIANSKEVISLKAFSTKDGKDSTYLLLLEMEPDAVVSSNSAVNILSTGNTSKEALAILNRFSKFFNSVSISPEVASRPDLSISRGIAGSALESKKQ